VWGSTAQRTQQKGKTGHIGLQKGTTKLVRPTIKKEEKEEQRHNGGNNGGLGENCCHVSIFYHKISEELHR